MKKIRIGIDASRNRSGGAKIHLIGILKDIDFNNYNIDEVHVWSYKDLLDQLPNYPWLKKHAPFRKKNIFDKRALLAKQRTTQHIKKTKYRYFIEY